MRLRRRLRLLALAALVAVIGVVAAIGGLSSSDDGHKGSPATHAMINGAGVTDAAWRARWSATAWVHVRLGDGGEEYCGGTMLTPTWLLTAAHCASYEGATRPAAAFRVVTGRARLSATGGTTSAVAQVVVRPGFTSPETGNDVALLRLAAPVDVQPLQLAGPDEDVLAWGAGAGRAATAATGPWTAGWGWTVDGDPSSAADTLRELQLPIVADGDCAANLMANFHPDSMLCAGVLDTAGIGAPSNARDTCQGDSGGPLLSGDGHGTWRIVAITSWGFACGGNAYGLYVRIAAYRDWIASVTGPGVIGSGLGTASPSGAARGSVPVARAKVAVTGLRRDGTRRMRAVVRVTGMTSPTAVVHLRLTSAGHVLYDADLPQLRAATSGAASRTVSLALRTAIARDGRVGVRATLTEARHVSARASVTVRP